MPGKFKATTEIIDGPIHQISVEGELDLSTAPQLEASLWEAVGDDGKSVLINLSDCEFIDSSGFAVIVEAWKGQERKNGAERLALCCASDQVERLLRITGAYDVIAIFDDFDKAVASLGNDGEPTTGR